MVVRRAESFPMVEKREMMTETIRPMIPVCVCVCVFCTLSARFVV